jgi:hypothetical protein
LHNCWYWRAWWRLSCCGCLSTKNEQTHEHDTDGLADKLHVFALLVSQRRNLALIAMFKELVQ